ncbi:K(+)-transporting ATPase subunit F [Corynebacterium hadale]|uniref:K(+)-transporting ATPase subunit F n=3 Tax=Corynebacterium TaxID=1716 RepID=A0A269PGD2_9CORY|nr:MULTISPECIES: K(+)-transporting ATPase subunit F [Corynebacterium]PAT04216.1 K(+)-transporting ATPase subunit F [Corynebacterium sp. NML 150383]PAT14164.1 K(+)-transporting ATPase subunit F [Corynebacterium sp. NML 120412]MBL7284938.1 K(+)-transporting ATPase subunit F [Corynebacterium godavarianum]MCG7253967.1 K(+)-transporting ATPase subunit F [Corynebacterium hadale]MCG7256922.1 K(+)-transporting ATPase subunit F [Corynebacterium hadale]
MMSTVTATVGLIVVALLVVYLVISLIDPERFA